MIKTFKCRDTESLFHDHPVRRFKAFEAQVRRRLKILHAATSIEALGFLPGNRLHKLSKERTGQYSISINMQWRICFVWSDSNACEVEIVDYH
jgi:proteic killer suppression protein